MNQTSCPPQDRGLKRMALYARVSTQEQTKKDYPSCESQIEELESYCRSKGWHVAEAIKDEGFSAGSLKRPGLTRLRSLVQSGSIEGVVCTWYDRLTRSREFYILDKEFRTHRVDFLTLHDPADRNTASGRFLEMMLVGAKAYEREQTGEKVQIKMRQRAEKGMWNGGLIPFGFMKGEDQILRPDGDKSKLVPQIFQVYIQHASDFAVRDWLKAHQIPAPGGKPVWAVGTIRDFLCNRRYIAEIELNKGNKGLEELSDFGAYRIVKAPHEPLVSVEVFELAQSIRLEKAGASPNRKGRPRSYSQNQCDRVFPLQGRLFCGECGHSMTPYYVVHQPNEKEKRRTASYVYYYMCAAQLMQGRARCGHSNRVLARIAESWISDQLSALSEAEGVVEDAIEAARTKCAGDLEPQMQALSLNRAALQENKAQIDRLIETITAGGVTGPLLTMLNDKAVELQREQERLKNEQRELYQALQPLQNNFDAGTLRDTLTQFSMLAKAAQPQEMQRLVRTMVNRIEWHPTSDTHAVEMYCLPNATPRPELQNQPPSQDEDWLVRNVWSGCPQGRNVEPVFLVFLFSQDKLQTQETSLLCAHSP